MFNQKVKRVISIMLIVAMTICSNGFSVLATSVDDVVQNNMEASEGKQTSNYYYEMMESYEETLLFKSNNNEENLEEEETEKFDGEIVPDSDEDETFDHADEPEDDEVSTSKDDETDTKAYEEETEPEESEESFDDDTKNEESSDKSVSEEESKEDSSEETSDDLESNETTIEETEDETYEETSEEEKETLQDDETSETSFIEEETTKEVEEETETTEMSQEALDYNKATEANAINIDDILDVKATESEIEFVDATISDADKDVKVVKKYIVATRSIPEDSVWKLVDILANVATASFVKIPSIEEIKNRYLADEVKVLVENQYGDQKVVTVPAKWNVQILSKVYRPEVVKKATGSYVSDEEGNVELVEKVEDAEDKIEEIESEDIEEETEENSEETVAGFVNTEEEEVETTVKGSDKFDTEIANEEVVYEYEEIKGDDPIVPDEDELEKTDVLKGNANNKVVNKNNAKEEGYAELDLADLASELGKLLGSKVSLDIEDGFGLGLLGATNHSHWSCGRAVCSDSEKNHFNENMETHHPQEGTIVYQAINNLDEFIEAISSEKIEKDYLYLTASISVTKMIKLTRPLYLCLNDYKLSFTAGGQLCTYYNETDPTVETLGTYPYAICICGCNDTRDGSGKSGADGYCGILDGLNDGRTAPAIFYTKSKGVYLYGLGNNSAVDANAFFFFLRLIMLNSSNINYNPPSVCIL